MSTTEFDTMAPAEDAPLQPNPPEVQRAVPFSITDPNFVPRERYFSREFFEAEKDHLWPHSWLMAARLEEIPYPGDYVEFEVAGNSILIIRQRDESVKALHNACRHRATELAKGCGRFPGGQIVCPFHGWRWNIDGSSSYVFMEADFDPACMQADDLRLRECLVELWSGMVWINMDLDAPPLMEVLSPVAGLLDGVGIGNMRVKWWKQVVLNANWKIMQEAFMEAYHAPQTHPQLMMGGELEDAGVRSASGTGYTAFAHGHGRFQNVGATGHFDLEQLIKLAQLLAHGQDAMALERDVQIFEGLRNKVDVHSPESTQMAVLALYEYAEGAGIPMAPLSEKMSLWSGEIFMFPNYLMLPMYGNCLCYRSRPYNDDPEWCLFDVWSLTTYPVGEEPERAELLGVFDKDDDENWGLIPRQDFGNIERQQRGMHSRSYEHMRLSSKHEKSIANMHLELDRQIAARS